MTTSAAAARTPAAALHDPAEVLTPEKRAAPATTSAANRRTLTTGSIVPLLASRRTCASCQRPLPRHAPARHRHCDKCHNWHQAGYFFALARAHLEKAEACS